MDVSFIEVKLDSGETRLVNVCEVAEVRSHDGTTALLVLRDEKDGLMLASSYAEMRDVLLPRILNP